MKITWKTEWPMIALLVGMFLLAAATWHTTPDRVPVHWSLSGEPDRWDDRAQGLLGIPILALFMYGLMIVLPRFDPGRMNYERFAGAYTTIRLVAIAGMAVFYGVVQLSFRGIPIDMQRFVGLAVGGMLFVIGNVLGKLRPNWFVGVRTPWTLSSKRSWNKTHRLAGWVFVAGGLALMAAGAVGVEGALYVAFGILAAGALWTIVYSYLVWRGDPERVPPAGTVPSNGEA